jgi:hypothetical protein
MVKLNKGFIWQRLSLKMQQYGFHILISANHTHIYISQVPTVFVIPLTPNDFNWPAAWCWVPAFSAQIAIEARGLVILRREWIPL